MTDQEITTKFEQLLKTKQFSQALQYAATQNSTPEVFAEISRLHGDHLYNKGEYKQAMQHYLTTMKYIDPSYIIHKYMDVSKISELVQYLEILHQNKLANHHHTSLLLNSYVKQQNLKKLNDFLNQGDLFTTVQFDTITAIKVCRDLKNTDLALNLAIKSLAATQVLEILINEKSNYTEALNYLQKLKNLQKQIELLKEFGKIFIKHKTPETVEFIKKLVLLSQFQKQLKSKEKSYYDSDSKQYSKEIKQLSQEFAIDLDNEEQFIQIEFPEPEDYLNLFLVNSPSLENYLKFLINLTPQLSDETVIFNRLFEYYLQEYTDYYQKNLAVWQLRKTADIELTKREKSIMSLLKTESYQHRYDKHQLLILCKMYNFDNGITYILDQLNMQLDLQMFYIEKQNDPRIIDICKEHGNREANLWVQALKYFTSPGKKVDYVTEILENIVNNDALSIQQILNILGKNDKIKFSMVKNYFKSKLSSDLQEIEKNANLVTKNMQRASTCRQEYKQLKTQAKFFTSTRCASCNNPLSMPSFHFLCGHSFDNDCLIQINSQVRECFICAPEFKKMEEKKNAIENEKNDYEQFVEQLEESCTKTEVLADYFGRGLIKNIDQLAICQKQLQN